MSDFENAIKAVEDFNMKACAITGAGKGHETTQEAIVAHRLYMREHTDEARKLIDHAQSFGKCSAFLAGFASYVDFYAAFNSYADLLALRNPSK